MMEVFGGLGFSFSSPPSSIKGLPTVTVVVTVAVTGFVLGELMTAKDVISHSSGLFPLPTFGWKKVRNV